MSCHCSVCASYGASILLRRRSLRSVVQVCCSSIVYPSARPCNHPFTQSCVRAPYPPKPIPPETHPCSEREVLPILDPKLDASDHSTSRQDVSNVLPHLKPLFCGNAVLTPGALCRDDLYLVYKASCSGSVKMSHIARMVVRLPDGTMRPSAVEKRLSCISGGVGLSFRSESSSAMLIATLSSASCGSRGSSSSVSAATFCGSGWVDSFGLVDAVALRFHCALLVDCSGLGELEPAETLRFSALALPRKFDSGATISCGESEMTVAV